MKFEFDSINELSDFLEFARVVGAAFREVANVPAERLHGEATAPDAHLTTEDRAAALATAEYPERSEWPNGDTPAPDAQSTPANAVAEAPKRKRRTKAEIEADRAAVSGTNLSTGDEPVIETPSDAQAAAATSPLAGANPFDASTSNAPAATAALNEAPAGATGTLAALGSEVVSAAVDSAPVDPQSYIALRVAEMGGVFDAREHMKKCVEFIGALGKARYDEAFDLAGTSRSVATYTPADCAKHIAALEYLQLSGKGA